MLKTATLVAGIATFMTVSVGARAAGADSVFGIALQKPLSLPQCPYETENGEALYISPQAGACYELPVGQQPRKAAGADGTETMPADGPVVIVWEVGDRPAIVAGRGVMATLAGGKLEGMVFETRGVVSQDEVYQALVGQFGTATSTESVPLQGIASSSALPMLAKWTLDTVDVLFYSAVDGINRGVVSINAHPPAARLSSDSSAAARTRTRS